MLTLFRYLPIGLADLWGQAMTNFLRRQRV